MSIDQRTIFYDGKYVVLKALEKADVYDSDWVGWFNDEQICRSNQHHYFPHSVETQLKFVESLACSKSSIALGIVSKEHPDRICGVVSLDNINFINRNCDISVIHDNKTKSNPSIFIESWKIMLHHGFSQLGLKKICAGTFHPHVADAIRRLFGFSVEGCKRAHVFKDGSFIDVTILAVFSETIIYPDL
jgi:RimJ/RimL family protein N-acetyltransferase